MERSYGKATRSIRLPENAHVSKANAAYENGVLHLCIPKRTALPSSRFKIPISDSRAGSSGHVAIEGKAESGGPPQAEGSAGGMEES